MGEPLAASVAKWFSKSFNLRNKAIVNTYYQTENGGILFSPTFKEDSSTFGTVGKSFCNKINLNIKKNSNKKEDLKVQTPWPGCMINVENENFIWEKYWDKNNFFNLFDVCKYDT